MADLATSAMIAASGIPVVIFTGALGFDPISMTAGLTGVVIVQTLLPPTVKGVRAIIGLGLGSTLLANITAPFVAALVVHWGDRMGLSDFLAQIDHHHVQIASAAFIGGFAQPILIRGKQRFFPEIRQKVDT